MAFKMKGFNPGKGTGIDMGTLPEVKVTDRYPSKKVKRKAEERKLTQELHKNPIIKAVHGNTDRAANVIKKIVKTGVELYTGSAVLSGAGKLMRARRLAKNRFNLSKIKKSFMSSVKESIKGVAPVVADDVVLGASTKKKNK